MKKTDRTPVFVTGMWEWFDRHKRELPWRDLQVVDDTQRAYMVLVSEVMLQQTQVPRVEIIFKRFLEQFPTLQSLAAASNKDVILAWRGMGYNSRALRLRDAAKTIVEQFRGVFPREVDELRSIKGIGAYTAGAIRNFAFGIPTPCIDTNIRRILHRAFVGPEGVKDDGTPVWEKSDKELEPLAEETLQIALEKPEHKNSADWHAALMDFGSAVCKKSSPHCDVCPHAKAGVCKSAHRISVKTPLRGVSRWGVSKEPGREVAGKFIPNRIFRGKVVELLRDESRGLTLEQIGRHVCIDWEGPAHGTWMSGILAALVKDEMIEKRKRGYTLKA